MSPEIHLRCNGSSKSKGTRIFTIAILPLNTLIRTKLSCALLLPLVWAPPALPASKNVVPSLYVSREVACGLTISPG